MPTTPTGTAPLAAPSSRPPLPAPDSAPPSVPSGLTQTGVTQSTVGLDLVGVERQRRCRRLWDLPRRCADRIDELARLYVRLAELRHDVQRRRRCLRRRRRPLRGGDTLRGHCRMQRRHRAALRSAEPEHRPRCSETWLRMSLERSNRQCRASPATRCTSTERRSEQQPGRATPIPASPAARPTRSGSRHSSPLGNTSNLTLATGPAATSACTPTADTQAPSSPGDLALGAVSQTSVSVSWSASSDNVGVVGYGYYRGSSLVGNGAGDELRVSAGLACGTGYSLGVDASTRQGTAPAATVAATTSACSPPPPPPPSPGSRRTSGSTRTAAPARDRQPQVRTPTRRRVPGARPIRAAQTGDLILVSGGNYGDVKIGPNKTSIAAPGVTFRTASGESVVVSDFENGAISGSGGGNNISFVGPVTARTFRTDRPNTSCGQLERRLWRLCRRADLPSGGGQQRHRPQLRDRTTTTTA